MLKNKQAGKAGKTRNKFAKNLASWIWTVIMNLDYKKRCRLAICGGCEDEKLWIVRQFSNFGYDRRIERTCKIIARATGVSKSLAEAARIALEKIKSRQ